MARCRYCGELIDDGEILCRKHNEMSAVKELVEAIYAQEDNPFIGQELFLTMEQIEHMLYVPSVTRRSMKAAEASGDKETTSDLAALTMMMWQYAFSMVGVTLGNIEKVNVASVYFTDNEDHDLDNPVTDQPGETEVLETKVRALTGIMKGALEDPGFRSYYLEWTEERLKQALDEFIANGCKFPE